MRKIGLLLLISSLSWSALAQYEEEKVYDPFDGRTIIGFSPQYLLMQGIRFNIDIPSKRNHLRYISLAPYLYSGAANQYEDTRQTVTGGTIRPEDYEKDRVKGIGLEVMRKHYFERDSEYDSPIFISYGLGYHYLRLDFPDFGMIPFEEEGLTLYRFGYAEQQERIHRVDAVFLIGATTSSRNDVLFFDIFLGPVLKNSFINSSLPETRDHNRMLRHGYDGVTLRVGFTIGVILP